MAVALVVEPDGPPSILVSGAVVSTVKLREAGVGSGLPAGSVARTSKLWPPSARGPAVCGAEHSPQPPPSIRHSNHEPGSFAEKPKVGDAAFVGPDGPLSMVVSGGVPSGPGSEPP